MAKKEMEYNLEHINNLVEKEGALVDFNHSINYSDNHSRHNNGFLMSLLKKYDLKRIGLSDAIKKSHLGDEYSEIEISSLSRIEPDTSVFYRNQGQLNHFIRKNFKKSKSITKHYFNYILK